MSAPSRILVVFYSRSETTAEFAGRLAAELDGDYERLEEVDFERRAGPFGFLRSIFDVVSKRPAHLQRMTHWLANYDVVLVGTPVWAARASTPVAAWLAQHWHEMPATAFFCTMGSRGSEDTFALLLHARAAALDCAERRVQLEDGSAVGYGKLVIATGAAPCVLDVPGAARRAAWGR